DEAYQLAGYRANRGNAARMKANESISTRLAEIQSAVAKKSVITIESICAELDEANAVAKERGQAAAMVSASALRAKLAGLMVDKVEVTNLDALDKATSFEDIADAIIDQCIEQFRPVDDQDRQGLIDQLEKGHAELAEYVAAIKARPIIAE